MFSCSRGITCIRNRVLPISAFNTYSIIINMNLCSYSISYASLFWPLLEIVRNFKLIMKFNLSLLLIFLSKPLAERLVEVAENSVDAFHYGNKAFTYSSSKVNLIYFEQFLSENTTYFTQMIRVPNLYNI